MRSVLHTTPYYAYSNFPPARSDSTSACVREGVWMGSLFQLTLGFIRAVARQKLHLQFLRANPLFTFTHDSCVTSTICHRVKSNLRAKNCVRNSSRYHMVQNCVTIQYNISLIWIYMILTDKMIGASPGCDNTSACMKAGCLFVNA
jgi:hypothetical protein